MRSVSRLVLAAAMLCAAALAQSGEATTAPKAQPERVLLQPPVLDIPSPITDRFAIRAVYFRPTIATDIRYDNTAGNPGTQFGAARELGLDRTSNEGWLDMMMRVTPRQRIEAEFYKMARTGDRVLDDNISFGNADFQAGDRVVSSMDLRVLEVTYLYSPLRRDNIELAVGLGIHLLQVEGSLQAPARFVEEHLDGAGPFPSLVVDGTWRLARRYSLNGTVQYLTVNSGHSDATYLSWRANLQYRGWRNLALGFGYSGARYKANSADPNHSSGFLNMWYYGPEAFVRVSF